MSEQDRLVKWSALGVTQHGSFFDRMALAAGAITFPDERKAMAFVAAQTAEQRADLLFEANQHLTERVRALERELRDIKRDIARHAAQVGNSPTLGGIKEAP